MKLIGADCSNFGHPGDLKVVDRILNSDSISGNIEMTVHVERCPEGFHGVSEEDSSGCSEDGLIIVFDYVRYSLGFFSLS